MNPLKINWIDYSSDHRENSNALSSRTLQSPVDELGIEPIRDGFSDVLLPGVQRSRQEILFYYSLYFNGRDDFPLRMNS